MAGRAGHALHLVRRFFFVLRAPPLTDAERDEVEVWLTAADRDLFWSQHHADQRHALDTARAVIAAHGADRTVVRAALFHDVGKIHSRLGPFRRSLATLGGGLGLPLPGAWQAYLDHGPLGADDLAGTGAEPLVVEFARLHPQPAPEPFDPAVWRALLDADDDG